MASDANLVTVEIDEAGIATVTLNSPDTFNAMSPAWGVAFKTAIASLEAAEGLRVVLLRAEGRAFCVGGDISSFSTATDPYTHLLALATDLHDGMLRLAALDAPLVVAVQGPAAGAGFSLVCAADIAVAGRSAFFSCAYTAAGLSPDGGMSWRLPRLIGRRRAGELMLTNRRVEADEAAAIGIVNEVVDDEALEAHVRKIAERLARGATPAFGATKRLLESAVNATCEEQLALEAESIATLAAGPSGREGVAAFLEKRKPNFSA